jgi:hypothetical protein
MDVAYVEDRMDTHLYYCTHTVASLYYHEFIVAVVRMIYIISV